MGKVAKKKNISFGGPDFEVVCLRASRSNTSFIPPINNFCYFPASLTKGKYHRAFVGLVSAVTFHRYLLIWHGE